MRIHHLNCGTMQPVGGRLINGNRLPFRTARMICHCLLIETDQGLVLVDTGIGLRDIADPRRSLGREFLFLTRPRLDLAETAVRQVTGLGYSADDVRHIILTHLDLDHAGGLPDFPKAKVHLHATEHRAAMGTTARAERFRYRAGQLAHGPDWVTYDPTGGDRWFGFEAVRQLRGISADIALIPLPGHTRGHAGVAVRRHEGTESATGPQWLLHAGDAYFSPGEIDPLAPRSTPGLALFQTLVQADGPARHRNQARLRELARDHGDQIDIFSAHDPVELDRCRQNEPRTAGHERHDRAQ
ncbi:MBL fold metallo-hydrolase [Streptomyces sp. NBC_00144]|uniref:MBL fold metallo-hydrolase n=1 Tax=unclassified Streptomyces TaxID=2593676 RepID=UPI003252D9B5|nr:MBL fold metallo-hydrolase [Streptomyces sp. NBC_00932]